MILWSQFSEECFQHLVASMSERINALLKAKYDLNYHLQDGPDKVGGEFIFADKIKSTNRETYRYSSVFVEDDL